LRAIGQTYIGSFSERSTFEVLFFPADVRGFRVFLNYQFARVENCEFPEKFDVIMQTFRSRKSLPSPKLTWTQNEAMPVGQFPMLPSSKKTKII
jgi:hypothetical protein